MYEQETYETILSRMLARVPADVDKREGSILYDALAPAAAELAQMYAELDINYNLSFADTATGDFLSRISAQFGINRGAATKARRKGEFFGSGGSPLNVPIGSRYGIDDLTYIVVAQIAPGVFTLECETAGVAGNQKFGALLPIVNVPGLATANLTDVLVPGEDEEDDESLRARYYDEVNEPAFGGNVADYKRKIKSIDGVGAVKVFPAWNGGGTVKCTIIASNWNAPSSQLVSDVQAMIDPPIQGKGNGLAPIGHTVTIAGVQNVTVNVVTTLTLAAGKTKGQVQADVEAAIAGYLLELRKEWANQTQLAVRIAQIDARIVSVDGVVDVTSTMINGSAANLVLTEEQIPTIGTVTIN